jgi:vacuole morphology and inheritance protein 14
VEFGPIISILVIRADQRTVVDRLTAITWLAEVIHHPSSVAMRSCPFTPEILSAILWCISDGEKRYTNCVERTDDDLSLVRDTSVILSCGHCWQHQ